MFQEEILGFIGFTVQVSKDDGGTIRVDTGQRCLEVFEPQSRWVINCKYLDMSDFSNLCFNRNHTVFLSCMRAQLELGESIPFEEEHDSTMICFWGTDDFVVLNNGWGSLPPPCLSQYQDIWRSF